MLRPLLFLVALLALHPAQARELDIPYGPDPAQRLDLYPAPGPAPHRLIVFFHGGGWAAGQKGVGRVPAVPLNAAGYTLASIGYRLVPSTDMAGALADGARATAFLLAHAKQYGLDPATFAIMGHSSGATMAALLGSDQTYLRAAGVNPAEVKAIVVLDGVTDIGAAVQHFPSRNRRRVFGTDPARWAAFSVDTHLQGLQPRVCFVHDGKHPLYIDQTKYFLDALHAAHVRFEELAVPDATHWQIIRQFDDPTRPMARFVIGCLANAWQK